MSEYVQLLLAQGEAEVLEFKSSFQKQVIESVVAFANAKGEKVLVGVSDAKQLLGVPVCSETLKDWQNQEDVKISV